MIEVQNHSNSLRQDISPKTTCKHFFSVIKNIDQEMNHSEDFGRVTWAGANMPTSWASKLHFFNTCRTLFCQNTTFIMIFFLFLFLDHSGQNAPGERCVTFSMNFSSITSLYKFFYKVFNLKLQI